MLPCFSQTGKPPKLCLFILSPSIQQLIFFRRNVVSNKPIDGPVNPDMDVYIGRSETAMWMRVVSSWVCMLLYAWSLLAPVVMPDR
jgi:hypothetical protein